MTRRKQQITERVPTTPRKVVVYTDNLMTSEAARNTAAVESSKELVNSLAVTLNTALVIVTSFRFNPELNMLEIIDPKNRRNNIIFYKYTNYTVSVKLFILPAAADTLNRPSHVYVRQVMECLRRQLGSVKIDELFVSFSDIALGSNTGGGSASEAEELAATSDSNISSDAETSSIQRRRRRHQKNALGRRAESSQPGTPSSTEARSSIREHHIQLEKSSSSSEIPSTAYTQQQDNDGSSGVGRHGMDRYVKLWRAVSRLRTSGDVGKIGLCDLSREQLENLCEKSGIRPDMLQVRVGESSTIDVTTPVSEEPEPSFEATTPTSAPVSAISDPLDDDLREYARANGISIRTHTDSADMLPDEAFQTLASDFRINEKFPTTEVPRHGFKMDFMRPRWVANYSVFLKTRGLVANRGYIVMASSDTVLDPNNISKYYGDSS
ncbi:hypothetical protein GGI23_000555 [Coemansia sp. RSA 2559]|nr:hypothetical protein GGI23_000555 [Coemansia sp. RSA 2559]KAJ2869085.1 hypothetical protein GGI22_000469 [Coemansia erecta]